MIPCSRRGMIPLKVASQFGGSSITGGPVTGTLASLKTPHNLTAVTSALAVRMSPSRFYKRYAVRLLVVLWILSTASAMIAGFTVTNHALNEQLSSIRKGIASTAASASLLIDGDEHYRLAQLGEAASE